MPDQIASKTRKRAVSPKSGSDITAYQFKPGNPGGPGRRPTKPIKDAILDKVESRGGWEEILAGVFREAMKGDVSAAKLLLEYGHGKPSNAPDAPPQEIRIIWEDPKDEVTDES